MVLSFYSNSTCTSAALHAASFLLVFEFCVKNTFVFSSSRIFQDAFGWSQGRRSTKVYSGFSRFPKEVSVLKIITKALKISSEFTYQTVMAAMLRHVAAIGTVLGFQRRSRSSTEPILACWFLFNEIIAARIGILTLSSKSRYSHFSFSIFRSGKVKLPEWVDLVKTNVAKELAPYDEDWYYTRLASMARHIYVRSPVGVGTACKIYGGKNIDLKALEIAIFTPFWKL